MKLSHLFKFRTSTQPFLDKENEEVEGSISEQLFLTIGGVKQWVNIRGRNSNLPILLFLHGGPGTSLHGLLRYYNSELENHFLVVGWDQRGTGKSYDREIDPKTMNIKQFVSDCHELVQYLKSRFKQEKIYLMGISWGTLFGTLYAKQYPEDLFAYIGIGQVSDVQRSTFLSLQYTREKAKQCNDVKALAFFQGLSDKPGNRIEDAKTQGALLTKFGGTLRNQSSLMSFYIPKYLSIPEYGWLDLMKFVSGNKFSLRTLWPEIFEVNLFKEVPSLEVPVYIILGRFDYCVPSSLSAEYYDYLSAPSKKLIWFESSAHNPPFEEPAFFNKTLLSIKSDLSSIES